MEVNGSGSISSPLPINRPTVQTQVAPTKPVAPTTPQDEVEISAAGRTMEDLTSSTGLHAERLAQIKASIDDGTYENQEKFDIAMSRLMDRIDRGEA